MSKAIKKNARNICIVVLLIVLILGYYFYLSNRTPREGTEEKASVSTVQQLLLRDLEKDYPPTPKEVVKCFADFTQCFYGEEYSEEELERLSVHIQYLYDEELLANNNTGQQYLDNLKWDINQMEKDNMVVSSYTTSASTDVEYFGEDGYEWARLNCTFTIRSGKDICLSKETFLLRKDAEGHWKIYGWALAEDDSTE